MGYQTISLIKGTPKHNKGISFRVLGENGRVLEIQIANSEKSKSLARERGERKDKIGEPRKRTLSHILETLQNIN